MERNDVSASGNAQQAVQRSGIQINHYGVGTAQAGSAVSITPPFGLRNERHPVRGRDKLLGELDDTAGQVRVVHGLGGCGKTTLALEVAHRARQRGTEVWWVSAVESDGLVAGMRAVGRRVGLNDAELTQGDACDLIWHRLADRNEPWLLVLDGADDPQILTGAGESAGDGRGWLRPVESAVGQVLVTSRDGGAARWGSWCSLYRLSALSTDDAARVLIDRAGNCGTDDEARALAERLGGLPMALRIAGSYLGRSAGVPGAFAEAGLIRTFRQYQEALDAGDLEEVSRATQDEAHRLIGRTWDMSLDLLDARQIPEARFLLRLLACFADAPISYETILCPEILAASPLFEHITGQRLWLVLRSLDGFGLIELVDACPPAKTPVARLHPLVRDASAPRSSPTDEERAVYLALAANLLKHVADADKTGRPEDPTTWPMWQLLSPHITHVFDALMDAQYQDEEPYLAIACAANRAARHQAALGLYSQAAAVQRRVLSIVEQALGSDHPHTLAIRHEIARLKAARGHHLGAEAEFRDVLIARLRVQGPDHPATLTTRHEIARMMMERGDDAGAEDELRDVLAARLRLQGANHPFTLGAHHAIAWLMAARGDYAGAESELLDVLAGRLRVQGPDHPDTLATRHNLAGVMADRGDYARAEAEFRDVLEAEERVLGLTHPSTRETAASLAYLKWRRAWEGNLC